jgi:pyrimidine-nucleoside phosphorylase
MEPLNEKINASVGQTPSSSSSAPSPSPSTSCFSALAVIRRRKHGGVHSKEELEWFVSEFTAGRIPDYQMAAWLMAVHFRPLSDAEVAILTRCMVDSGTTLRWSDDADARNASGSEPCRVTTRVDKHSSGGVGDKTSLLLAPWLAVCGYGGGDDSLDRHFANATIQVPMMAGRGLGHTGGTIDKLESIPGFGATLTIQAFQEVVQTVGCAITSPTAELCPADRALYALRDASGTVESVGLQTASILSKKLAENPDVLVLDVKHGSGAFQDNIDEALELATGMVRTASLNGLKAVALLTRMDHPLGQAVGNWLEVAECVQLMTVDTERSRLSIDLMVVTMVLALEMLHQTTHQDPDVCLNRLIRKLESGHVRAKFDEMVAAQGGDATCLEAPLDMNRYGSPVATLRAARDGTIASIHGKRVGIAAVSLGAGRLKAADPIDFGAGLLWHKQVGDVVRTGDVIADVYSKHTQHTLEPCLEELHASIEYGPNDATTEAAIDRSLLASLVTHKVTADGIEPYHIPPRIIEFAIRWCTGA